VRRSESNQAAEPLALFYVDHLHSFVVFTCEEEAFAFQIDGKVIEIAADARERNGLYKPQR
jgi:hypothetical protein